MSDQISKRKVITLGVLNTLYTFVLVVAAIVDSEHRSWFSWLIWGGMFFCNLMFFGKVYKQYKKQKTELNKGE